MRKAYHLILLVAALCVSSCTAATAVKDAVLWAPKKVIGIFKVEQPEQVVEGGKRPPIGNPNGSGFRGYEEPPADSYIYGNKNYMNSTYPNIPAGSTGNGYPPYVYGDSPSQFDSKNSENPELNEVETKKIIQRYEVLANEIKQTKHSRTKEEVHKNRESSMFPLKEFSPENTKNDSTMFPLKEYAPKSEVVVKKLTSEAVEKFPESGIAKTVPAELPKQPEPVASPATNTAPEQTPEPAKEPKNADNLNVNVTPLDIKAKEIEKAEESPKEEPKAVERIDTSKRKPINEAIKPKEETSNFETDENIQHYNSYKNDESYEQVKDTVEESGKDPSDPPYIIFTKPQSYEVQKTSGKNSNSIYNGTLPSSRYKARRVINTAP